MRRLPSWPCTLMRTDSESENDTFRLLPSTFEFAVAGVSAPAAMVPSAATV